MKKLLLISSIFWLFNHCQGLRFRTEFIYVTIYEEAQPGSFVARASASPDPIRYELSAGAGNFYAIDNATGVITVQRRFDREAQNYTDGSFMVYAFDGAGNKASAKVWFWIQDINDHSPHFPSQYYNVTVGEAVDINQQIFSATALDEDFEENAEILYEIADGNEDGMFKLKDAYHCKVLLVKALDFESRSSYLLNITASNYHKSFSNWTILSITVADVDDLPARFSTFVYSAFIREDAAVGTSIIQVTATDQDELNDPVTYEIVELTNNHSLFVINVSTGVILLNGTLDREAVPEYKLRVLAYSTFHLPDHATVEIHIGDVNDNPPVFADKFYSFVIRENAGIGAIVGQVEASDADQGNNAAFSYILLDNENPFNINPNTGVLIVNGSLDREKQDRYSFLVFAKEFHTVEKYTSNATVNVTVEDRNDNSPHFVKPFYEVTVQEELPSGTTVLEVFANDSDVSSNAFIIYSLVPDSNDHYLDFVISPVNGSIRSAKQLDRENISEYYLTVKAENSGQKAHRRSTTVSVKITVQDINDNLPIFGKHFYTVTVTEATAVNTTILTVQATDKDLGQNSEIEYTLEEGNLGSVFNIEGESGSISIAEDLDREQVEVYNLIVQAKDGGNKSITVNVTVFVNDVNDNSPQFTSPGGYQFSVMEETAGLPVGTVKANDSDIGENAEIIYSLMHTPSSRSFRINSSTGEISTTEALDYEALRSHVLIVQAEDRGLPQSRRTAVQVSINVTDVNDNAPKFLNLQPDVNLMENPLSCRTYNTTDFTVIRVRDLTPANTEIGRVATFDRDYGVNSKIFYRIEGNDSKVFSITSRTGIIYTNRQLKRDEQPVYNLTVIAENSLAAPKLSSNMTVQIIVYDLTGQTPQFTSREYHAEIAESVAAGTSVIKINVTNNVQATSYFVFKILYDQSSAGSRKFMIEPETGLVTTQGELDRETTANYTLMVEAKLLNPDPAHRLLASVVPVFIKISDVDDNYPRFLQRTYRFIPSELSRVGDVIGQVKAVDIDKDNQSEVFYEIGDGNEKGLFNISEDQGTIYVRQCLEHEAASTIQLQIWARDSSAGPKSRKRRDQPVTFDEVTATIEIQDENNNPPVFTQTQYIGGFYEGEAVKNAVVATIQALDKDSGAYGSVQYSIVHEETSGMFSLDSITGDVSLSNLSVQVTGKLDYALKVSAVDNLGKAPYNKANQNASVVIFLLPDSKKQSLELGVPVVFVREKRSEIESMLHNLTGGTVMIKDIHETGDGSSIIYFHAIDNRTLSVLTQEDFMRRLQNNTDLISDVFKKWNIRMPSGGTAGASTGSRKEFSILIAVMMVLSAGIGVAGIIGIIIARRKRKRQKSVYKTAGESRFPLATAWYSMDIPGIEAFIDSKADGTRQPLKDNTKYTVQKVPTNSGDFTLLRTPLRSSGSYKVKNQERKKVEQKREAVALNHYESTPSSRPDSGEINEAYDTVDNLTNNATPIAENGESHDNAGFDHSQGRGKSEEKPEERQAVGNSVDKTPRKKRVPSAGRRVRFDLHEAKDKKAEKRAARKNIPDIIVISEEAEGNLQLDENERKRVCDEEEEDNDEDVSENMPVDVSSIFEESRRRAATMAAVSDEEGTVVEI